ncbi:unnamed protein product, partial [Closterium sp. NIES-53]
SNQPPPAPHAAAGPSGSAPRGPAPLRGGAIGGAAPPGASSRAAAQQFSRQFTSIMAQASTRHAHAQAHAAGAQSRVFGGGAAGASRVFAPGAGSTRQFQAGGAGVGSFAAGVGGSFAGGSFAGANPTRMFAGRTRVLPLPAPAAAAPAAAAAAAAPPAGAARGLTPQQMAKIEDIFSVFDKDKSALLLPPFHPNPLCAPPAYPLCSQLGINVSQEEFEEIFATMDRNGDGSIDFEEYVAVMSGYMGEQNMHQDLIAMYQLFSDKRTVNRSPMCYSSHVAFVNAQGKISQRTLKRGVLDLGIVFSDDNVPCMCCHCTHVNAQGKISQRTLKRGVLDLGIVFSDDEIRGMFYSADVDGMFWVLTWMVCSTVRTWMVCSTVLTWMCGHRWYLFQNAITDVLQYGHGWYAMDSTFTVALILIADTDVQLQMV